jgi:hypothetical protein
MPWQGWQKDSYPWNQDHQWDRMPWNWNSNNGPWNGWSGTGRSQNYNRKAKVQWNNSPPPVNSAAPAQSAPPPQQ